MDWDDSRMSFMVAWSRLKYRLLYGIWTANFCILAEETICMALVIFRV